MEGIHFIIHSKESIKLTIVKLPHPGDADKDGTLRDFLYDEDNLTISEITKFSDNFRSWFFDDLFKKEGEIYMFTKVDPIYLFLPFLKRYSENFRTLHDICSLASDNLPDQLDIALNPSIDWSLVCDTKEIDGELYIKYNESKVLDWLETKNDRLVSALGKMWTDPRASMSTLASYAYDLIGNYLADELFEKFKRRVRTKSGVQLVEIVEQKVDLKQPKPGIKRPLASHLPKRTKHLPSSSPNPKQGTILNFFSKKS